jgi:hypothetical protein
VCVCVCVCVFQSHPLRQHYVERTEQIRFQQSVHLVRSLLQLYQFPHKRSKVYIIVWKKKAHKTVTVICVLGIVILCNACVLPF